MFANVVNLIGDKLFPMHPIFGHITNPPKKREHFWLLDTFPSEKPLNAINTMAKIGRTGVSIPRRFKQRLDTRLDTRRKPR